MGRYNKYQQQVLNVLGTRPVLFNPDLAHSLGSVTASLFLSQLLYWWKKGSNPEMVYKTVKEFEEETALTKNQQLNAQRICVSKGVIEVLHKGIPPKRHFKINVEKICQLLSHDTKKGQKRAVIKWLKSRQSNVHQSPKRVGDFLPHITDSTQKKTTETFRDDSASDEKAGGKPPSIIRRSAV